MVKVAITGGPCAGKSSSLSTLVEKLEERGYKVILVREAATKLISDGIIPGKNISILNFQSFVLDEQLHNEKIACMAAEMYKSSYKDVIVLCDRGLADQMAYISRDEFELLLKERNMSISDTYNYDCVLHLVTAADGAEDSYEWAGSENTDGVNMARSETPEEAIKKDHMTQDAWVGSAHLRVIDNSTDFEKKKMRVLEEVFNVLGEPVPLEIERKFLIKMPTGNDISMLGYTSKSNIIQTYLTEKEAGVERRVRQRGTKEDGFNFYYTEKRTTGYGEREENEIKISAKEYVSLLTEADISLHQILKTRYCFLYRKRYFELDIYPFSNQYAILEIEVNNIHEEVELPPLHYIKEVTGDKCYKNNYLAKTMALHE